MKAEGAKSGLNNTSLLILQDIQFFRQYLPFIKRLQHVVCESAGQPWTGRLTVLRSFVFTFGETEFSSYLKGYEGVQCRCHNCGNYSAHVMTRWPWFTFCFIVSLWSYTVDAID